MKKKELLFSVSAKDCRFIATRGRGKGGQKKNKTSSAIHCIHDASGAAGFSEDSREQSENRRIAFRRMAETREFQEWARIKGEAHLGHIEVEEAGENGIREKRKLNPKEVDNK